MFYMTKICLNMDENKKNTLQVIVCLVTIYTQRKKLSTPMFFLNDK